MKRFIIPVVILFAALGVMRLLSSLKKEQGRGNPKPFVRIVQTQVVHYDTVHPVLESMGRALAYEQVSLTPEVSGLVLSNDFRMRKGVSFRRGAVLFRIDSRQARYALETAVSDLQNALASVLPELKTDLPEAYERWYGFFSGLSADSIGALPATQSQREKLLVTRHAIVKLYYTARNQRLLYEKHVLRAPFSGTVESSTIYPSSMARAGTAVGTIVRTDEMEIELPLPRHAARFIRAGMTVWVKTDGVADSVKAAVHRISDILDEHMQTVPVFIRIGDASRLGLKSGYYTNFFKEKTLKGRVHLMRIQLRNF